MSKENTPLRMQSLANIVLRKVQYEIESLGRMNMEYQRETSDLDSDDPDREFISGVISGQDMAIVKLQVLQDQLKQLFEEVDKSYYLEEKDKDGYTYRTPEGFVTWE